MEAKEPDRDLLQSIARTSLRTKLPEEVADHMTKIVTDAVLTVRQPGKPLDLHMVCAPPIPLSRLHDCTCSLMRFGLLQVEIMHMKHKTALDSAFIDGLVLDHGARHPDMSRRNENCYLLVLNVSLEYEKRCACSSSARFPVLTARRQLQRGELGLHVQERRGAHQAGAG